MDTLLRGSRRVSELFSQALAEQRIQTPEASIRILPGGLSRTQDLEIDFGVATNREGFGLHVYVPANFHQAEQRARDELATTMWQDTLKELAARQGWDASGVDRAADSVRAADFQLSPRGPWRARAGLAHRFRLAGNLHDDGFFRLWIEIDSIPESGSITSSAEFLGGSTMSSFSAAAKTFEWTSDNAVSGSVVSAGVVAQTGVVTVNAAAGFTTVIDGPPEPLPLSKAVSGLASTVGFRFREPIESHVDVFYGGGGPTNDVPPDYLDEAALLGRRVREPEWLAWWAQLGVSTVFGTIDYAADRPRIATRLVGVELRIDVARPQSSIPEHQDARSLARQDLATAIDQIVKRRSATPPPPFDR